MDYTINVLVIVNLILCLYFIYISCNLLIEKFDVKSPTDMSHNHYSDVSDVANNEGCGSLCVQQQQPPPQEPQPPTCINNLYEPCTIDRGCCGELRCIPHGNGTLATCRISF
jgi:hypothetical protein